MVYNMVENPEKNSLKYYTLFLNITTACKNTVYCIFQGQFPSQ